MDLNQLQTDLYYQFKNIDLLLHALTHASVCVENRSESNQRLEFLGDAVIELTISKYLYLNIKNVSEGILTKKRSNIVSERPLSIAAKNINLGQYIIMSQGEKRSGGANKPSILSDTFEAVMAAIFLDGGFEAAQKSILILLDDEIKAALEVDSFTDYKSLMQEKLQENGSTKIFYVLEETKGPAHERTFRSSVWQDDKKLSEGVGKSRKSSEQDAAKNALISLELITK